MPLITVGSLVCSVPIKGTSYTSRSASMLGRVLSISESDGKDIVTAKFPPTLSSSSGEVISGPIEGFAAPFDSDDSVFAFGETVVLQKSYKDSRVWTVEAIDPPQAHSTDLSMRVTIMEVFKEGSVEAEVRTVPAHHLLWSGGSVALESYFAIGTYVRVICDDSVTGEVVKVLRTPIDVFYCVRLSSGELLCNVPQGNLKSKKTTEKKTAVDIGPLKKALANGMASEAVQATVVKGKLTVMNGDGDVIMSQDMSVPLGQVDSAEPPSTSITVELDDPMETAPIAVGAFDFFVDKAPQNFGTLSLYARLTAGPNTPSHQQYVVLPWSVTAVPEGSQTIPMATITKDSAVRLLDELWGAGLRPTGFVPGPKIPEGSRVVSESEWNMLQQYLNDFRSLVSACHKVDL